MASITTWHRLEPRPRAANVRASLRAEVRDPLWFLGRQWQLGEFQGEDAGSPAFVELGWRTVKLVDVALGGAPPTVARIGDQPLERQALAEPVSPDQATRVELGQTFFRILEARNQLPPGPPRNLAPIKTAFRQAAALADPVTDPFNPVEESTRQFMSVVKGRAVDGVKVLELAGTDTVPPGVPAADAQLVRDAYGELRGWVTAVFGAIGTSSAAAWDPRRLDQSFTVRAGPEAAPTATLAVQPDAEGALHWSSFDLQAQTGDPLAGAAANTLKVTPIQVRFPGMPANRYWDFEEGDLALPDIDLEKRDLQKLLVVDFALVHGVDWFVLGLELPVGSITSIDSLVVRDVFGGSTSISRADNVAQPAGPGRWTMFSVAQPGAGLAGYTLIPPSAGPGVAAGPILEDVRFARDEMANMAWAIERAAESRLGEPRPGPERDAAADAAAGPPAPPAPTRAPLRYQIESKVPLHWIPLVGVPVPGHAPDIQLQKARVLRPDPTSTPPGQPRAVPPIGRVLRPEPMLVPEEEIPRMGLRIERVVFRSRWIDGTGHLWIARRRRAGAGETQSGLTFDAARPAGEA
jgi:hypothetical protein